MASGHFLGLPLVVLSLSALVTSCKSRIYNESEGASLESTTSSGTTADAEGKLAKLRAVFTKSADRFEASSSSPNASTPDAWGGAACPAGWALDAKATFCARQLRIEGDPIGMGLVRGLETQTISPLFYPRAPPMRVGFRAPRATIRKKLRGNEAAESETGNSRLIELLSKRSDSYLETILGPFPPAEVESCNEEIASFLAKGNLGKESKETMQLLAQTCSLSMTQRFMLSKVAPARLDSSGGLCPKGAQRKAGVCVAPCVPGGSKQCMYGPFPARLLDTCRKASTLRLRYLEIALANPKYRKEEWLPRSVFEDALDDFIADLTHEYVSRGLYVSSKHARSETGRVRAMLMARLNTSKGLPSDFQTGLLLSAASVCDRGRWPLSIGGLAMAFADLPRPETAPDAPPNQGQPSNISADQLKAAETAASTPLPPAPAGWTDLGSTPHLQLFKWDGSGKRLYMARVDLSRMKLSLRIAQGRLQPVTSISGGCKVAVNAGYFSSYQSMSLLVDKGKLVAPGIVELPKRGGQPKPVRGALLFESQNAQIDWVTMVGDVPVRFEQPQDAYQAQHLGGWLTENASIVGGGPILLNDGKKWVTSEHELFDNSSGVNPNGAAPRTAVGVDPTGRILHLLVADGRTRGAAGMSLPNLADVFLDFGVKDAVNMDGGGSTTFVVDFGAGPEVVNRPSDGGQRPVFSALCLEGQ